MCLDISSENAVHAPSPQSKSQFSEPVIVGMYTPMALAICKNCNLNRYLLPLRKAGRIAPVPKNVRISSLLAMRMLLSSQSMGRESSCAMEEMIPDDGLGCIEYTY